MTPNFRQQSSTGSHYAPPPTPLSARRGGHAQPQGGLQFGQAPAPTPNPFSTTPRQNRRGRPISVGYSGYQSGARPQYQQGSALTYIDSKKTLEELNADWIEQERNFYADGAETNNESTAKQPAVQSSGQPSAFEQPKQYETKTKENLTSGQPSKQPPAFGQPTASSRQSPVFGQPSQLDTQHQVGAINTTAQPTGVVGISFPRPAISSTVDSTRNPPYCTHSIFTFPRPAIPLTSDYQSEIQIIQKQLDELKAKFAEQKEIKYAQSAFSVDKTNGIDTAPPALLHQVLPAVEGEPFSITHEQRLALCNAIIAAKKGMEALISVLEKAFTY